MSKSLSILKRTLMLFLSIIINLLLKSKVLLLMVKLDGRLILILCLKFWVLVTWFLFIILFFIKRNKSCMILEQSDMVQRLRMTYDKRRIVDVDWNTLPYGYCKKWSSVIKYQFKLSGFQIRFTFANQNVFLLYQSFYFTKVVLLYQYKTTQPYNQEVLRWDQEITLRNNRVSRANLIFPY